MKLKMLPLTIISLLFIGVISIGSAEANAAGKCVQANRGSRYFPWVEAHRLSSPPLRELSEGVALSFHRYLEQGVFSQQVRAIVEKRRVELHSFQNGIQHVNGRPTSSGLLSRYVSNLNVSTLLYRIRAEILNWGLSNTEVSASGSIDLTTLKNIVEYTTVRWDSDLSQMNETNWSDRLDVETYQTGFGKPKE